MWGLPWVFPLIPLPSRYPKSCIHLPSTSAAARHCLGNPHLEGQTKAEPLHCRCISNGLPQFPAILLGIKSYCVSPQEPMAAADKWSVTRNGTRPTQVGFVSGGGTVKWPRSSVASQCDMSRPSRGCSMCSAPDVHRPSHTRREAQTRAALASPRPRGCSAGGRCSRRARTGTARHGSARTCLPRHRLGLLLPCCATIKWQQMQHLSETCTN